MFANIGQASIFPFLSSNRFSFRGIPHQISFRINLQILWLENSARMRIPPFFLAADTQDTRRRMDHFRQTLPYLDDRYRQSSHWPGWVFGLWGFMCFNCCFQIKKNTFFFGNAKSFVFGSFSPNAPVLYGFFGFQVYGERLTLFHCAHPAVRRLRFFFFNIRRKANDHGFPGVWFFSLGYLDDWMGELGWEYFVGLAWKLSEGSRSIWRNFDKEFVKSTRLEV